MTYKKDEVVLYQMGSEMGFSAPEVPATILAVRVIDALENQEFDILIHETGEIIVNVSLDGLGAVG